MPTLIDLPGRQGRVVDAYAAAAIDFGRRAIAKLAADALARHLRTGDANSLIMSWRLFNAEEIHRLVQVYAAVVATAELLGRSDVRQQWAATLAAHGELPAPLTEAVSNRLNRMFAAWLAPIREDARDAVQPMPPEAALEYFRGLTPALGVDVQRFGDDLRRRVFTMAVATDTTILQRVQGVIADRMQTGVGFSTAAADIQDVLRAAGVDRGGAYAEAVFRTNTMDAYNQARTQEMRDPDVAAAFPVWEYVNPSDSRSRPEHAARNGKYYPSSVSFNEVRGVGAKDVIQCRCSFVAVSRQKWNRLKAAGARIADGYPDVPSMDELAAAAGATTSTQQRQPQLQPPPFEPQPAARAEIRALTGESEPATPQPIIVRRIQSAEQSPAVGAGATVEPWQLPLDEWHKRFGADRSFAESSAIHAAAVDAAMQAGKPVRWSAFYYHPELTRKYRVGVSGGYADPGPPAVTTPAPALTPIVQHRTADEVQVVEPTLAPPADTTTAAKIERQLGLDVGKSRKHRKSTAYHAGIPWEQYEAAWHAVDPAAKSLHDANKAVQEYTDKSRAAALEAEEKHRVEQQAAFAAAREAEQKARAEAAAKLDAERKQKIAAEIEADRDIEPDWQSYRNVMSKYIPDALQALDAMRNRDMGDIIAYKSSLEWIESRIGDAGTLAQDVWASVRRSGTATEKQMKAIAIGLAKAETKQKMWETSAPVISRPQAASTPLSEPPPEPAASSVPTATEPSPLAAIQSIADRFRELDYQEITDAVQAALSSVRAADAVAIAQRLGIADATGRKDAIAKIASRIRDRKESWDRVAQIGGAPLPRQVTPPGPAPFANVNTQRADSERVELAFVGDSVVVRPYFPPGSPPIRIAKNANFLGWTWAELRAMGEGYFVLREKR